MKLKIEKRLNIKFPYPTRRLIMLIIGVAILFYFGSLWKIFMLPAIIATVALFVPTIYNALKLYLTKGEIICQRIVPEVLSNGDQNEVVLRIKNTYPFSVRLSIEDDTPVQLQLRNFSISAVLEKGEEKEISYTIRPTLRGKYEFGDTVVFVSILPFLLEKKIVLKGGDICKVMPSFAFLHNIELLSIRSRNQMLGLHKQRRIGQSKEFENIREYAIGDDYRIMNWKATARKHNLMVNQYTEERSQNIYSIIDKGRGMQHTFDGLSLLDYAINSSLQLSYIALTHHDNAGLLTFENKVSVHIPAAQSFQQLNKMQECLYDLTTHFMQSDYTKLYAYTSRNIKKRSLMVIYTSFDSLNSLRRQLPYIQLIAKFHIVLVAFFIDSDVYALADEDATDSIGNSTKMVAQKFMFEQKQIVKELSKRGIYSLLTHPRNLNANVINHYLEFKARGII